MSKSDQLTRFLMLPCLLFMLGQGIYAQAVESPEGEGSQGRLIYHSDFSKAKDAAWSRYVTQKSKNSDVKALGAFKNEQVRLSLKDLPRHKAIRVEAVLIIKGGWTGNRVIGNQGQMIGPNFWGMKLNGDTDLIFTTFSTREFDNQSYPGFYRSENQRGKGQLLNQKLMSPFKDSHVYRLEQSFHHQASILDLDFYGMGLGIDGERQWLLKELRVYLLDELPSQSFTTEQLKALLKQLGDGDPAKVKKAIDQLVSMDESSLKNWLALLKDTDAGPKIQSLIDQLTHPDLNTRQRASEKLVESGSSIASKLRTAMDEAESLEQRDALARILKHVAEGARFETQHRLGLHVLKRVNTRQSLALEKVLRAKRYGGVGIIESQSRWEGMCFQEGRRPYAMILRIDEVGEDGAVKGEIHWPDLRDSKTRFRGKLSEKGLEMEEYELFQGTGIVIPVDYHIRLVHGRIQGFWKDPNDKEWGYIHLEPVVYRE